MLKTDVERALRTHIGGEFANRKEIADTLGYKDAHAVDRFIKGLPRIGNRYYIGDVAERIIEVAR